MVRSALGARDGEVTRHGGSCSVLRHAFERFGERASWGEGAARRHPDPLDRAGDGRPTGARGAPARDGRSGDQRRDLDEPFDRLGFPVIVALLTGQEVALAAGGEAFGYGGSGRVGLRFLPLGLVTLSAVALLRVPFTRAWMSVRQAAWLPPVCGVVGTAVVAVIGMIAASFAGIDVGFARAGLQVRFSLVGLLLVGAGPWLLAQLAVRWPVVRNLLYGLVGLQLLLILLLTGSAVLNGPEGISGGEQTAYLVFTFLASVVWSLNVLVALLWWPFVGALGMGGSVGSVLSIAGEAPRLGFLEAAGEQPFLWLAPVLAVAGIVAAMWFLPAPTSWADVRNRVGRFTLGIGVLVLPALWAGRLRIAGSGDIAGELVEEATWFLGVGGIGGDARAQVDVTFGAIGLPIRFLPALLIWAGLAALVSVLVAQRAGAQWADSGVIANDARKAGARWLLGRGLRLKQRNGPQQPHRPRPTSR
jgi:hypothetical protein